MKKETILPEGWPRPKGYANGVLVEGPCRWLFIAGQVGWDREERMVEGGFLAQFRQALSNVVEVLGAAGGDPSHLVEMTVYVTDTALYEAELKGVGEAWKNLVGRHFPAMALVQVAALLEEGALVELQARAALPRD
ncbi:MAG TPA: RidA family protein [Planctomycetes bacterium]|nr:RidA family protein [Planctomycetota bacterium]